MQGRIDCGGRTLAAHLARPDGAVAGTPPGLVLCHGFPAGPRGAAASGQTYPQLADRLAADTGWTVLTFNFRGTGGSEGDFSLGGWIEDLRCAVDHLLEAEKVSGAWVAGAGTGGAVAICEAAEDERVRGVATLAAPADFDAWAADAEGLLAQARRIGVVRDPAFPPDFEAWKRQLGEVRPLGAAAKIPPRPFLLVHGTEDTVVPQQDARAIGDAAHGEVELRIVNEAGHRLRHDPRAVAVLIGWMERQSRT